MFDIFKDSHKMKAVDRRMIREKRASATASLFSTMIWLVFIFFLLLATYMAYTGG